MHPEKCTDEEKEEHMSGNSYPVLTTNNTYKGTLCSNGKRQAPGITITTELFVPFSDAAVSKVIE